MYTASTGNKFTFVFTDEITDYLVTIPLYRGTSYEVGEAHINYVFYKCGPLLIYYLMKIKHFI